MQMHWAMVRRLPCIHPNFLFSPIVLLQTNLQSTAYSLLLLLSAVALNNVVGLFNSQLARFANIEASLFGVLKVEKHQPSVVVSFTKIWIDVDGLGVVGNSLGVFVGEAVEISAVVVNVREIGDYPGCCV